MWRFTRLVAHVQIAQVFLYVLNYLIVLPLPSCTPSPAIAAQETVSAGVELIEQCLFEREVASNIVLPVIALLSGGGVELQLVLNLASGYAQVPFAMDHGW